jgi:hypothetical protein
MGRAGSVSRPCRAGGSTRLGCPSLARSGSWVSQANELDGRTAPATSRTTNTTPHYRTPSPPCLAPSSRRPPSWPWLVRTPQTTPTLPVPGVRVADGKSLRRDAAEAGHSERRRRATADPPTCIELLRQHTLVVSLDSSVPSCVRWCLRRREICIRRCPSLTVDTPPPEKEEEEDASERDRY